MNPPAPAAERSAKPLRPPNPHHLYCPNSPALSQLQRYAHAILPDRAAPALTSRAILSLYLPLALSWVFMAIESPICIAILQGIGDGMVSEQVAKVSTAGMNLLMALAIAIESPVIDLLSTSTTLSRHRQGFAQMTRFAVILMAVVTIVQGTVAFTPLYWHLTIGLLNTPREVAEAVHTPMQIILFWSAAVGWRRYLQGVMIRRGVTRPISFGTLVRVVTMFSVGFGLSLATDMPKLNAVAFALFSSVFTEALFIHFVSRSVVRELPEKPDEEPPLNLRRLVLFHLPLTGSTFVTLMALPMINAALGRLPNPVLTMASYQVGFSLIWLFRTATFAMPEAVITLYDRGEKQRILFRFCLTVGALLSGLMLIFHLTGLDAAYFRSVLAVREELIAGAAMIVLWCSALPIINALMSALRGFLTAEHVTSVRLYAIAGGMSTLAICLYLGVYFQHPGLATAITAMIASQVVELGILSVFWLTLNRRNLATA